MWLDAAAHAQIRIFATNQEFFRNIWLQTKICRKKHPLRNLTSSVTMSCPEREQKQYFK